MLHLGTSGFHVTFSDCRGHCVPSGIASAGGSPQGPGPSRRVARHVQGLVSDVGLLQRAGREMWGAGLIVPGDVVWPVSPEGQEVGEAGSPAGDRWPPGDIAGHVCRRGCPWRPGPVGRGAGVQGTEPSGNTGRRPWATSGSPGTRAELGLGGGSRGCPVPAGPSCPCERAPCCPATVPCVQASLPVPCPPPAGLAHPAGVLSGCVSGAWGVSEGVQAPV